MKAKLVLLVALPLLFIACQEDGDDFIPEGLNKNVERGPKPGDDGVSSISFLAASIKNGQYYTGANCLPEERQLLLQGNFSGKLSGFGKINSSLSTFEFNSCEELPSNPNRGEPWEYALVAEGTLALSTRDFCQITITGTLYPWYYSDIELDGGTFVGTATMHGGTGKLSGFNQVFEVSGWQTKSSRINLTTGEIVLLIRELN